MYKNALLLVLLSFSVSTFSQITFENILTPPFGNFLNVGNSAVAFSDVDEDGDLDVFITGVDISNDRRALLYINTGAGGYKQHELLGVPFIEISSGAVDFADVDGDGDQDLFMTGSTAGGFYESNIYMNQGNGGFLYNTGNILTPLIIGDSKFVDVDNDGDFDLLSVGYDGSGSVGQRCILAVNDGLGNFTETNPIGLGMVRSTIDLGDIDGDGDLDVLISGEGTAPLGNVTRLYRNLGNGGLNLINGTPFTGVENGSAKFIDANDDGNLDVLVYGGDDNGIRTAKLYLDLGTNSYIEDNSFNHIGLNYCSVEINDIDLDGDSDFIASGMSDTGNVTLLYLNNGNASFSISVGTSFENVSSGTIDFHDINEDGYDDVLITGALGPAGPLTSLYLNDGLGNFQRMIGNPLEPMEFASASFADIDGDLDLDLITLGTDETFFYSGTYLFRNDGTGNYSREINIPFEDVHFGDVLFLDVDQDNDQDVLITGQQVGFSGPPRICSLYLNDGTGGYSVSPNQAFTGVSFSASSAADLDNDSDIDIIVTGLDSADQMSTKVYLNDGFGQFIESASSGLLNYSNGDIQIGDIDNDGDFDVLLGGYSPFSLEPPRFFLNNGAANFTLMSGTSFPASANSEYVLFDADGDADLDVFFSGVQVNNQPSELYINDGFGNFSLSSNVFETFLNESAVDAIDLEGDGDLDLMVSSVNVQPQKPIAYINDGFGNFVMFDFPSLPFFEGTTRMADIDGDSDPDLLTLGKRQTGILVAELYLNTNCISSFDTLDITACESYLAPSGQVLSVSGNYQDSIVTGIGCTQYFDINLDLISIDISVSNLNGTLTSNATGTTFYQWLNCGTGVIVPGENSQSFTPDTSGYYSVIISKNSCTDTSACEYVNVASLLNIDKDYVHIYPNPVENLLTLKVSTELIGEQVQLLSIQGVSIFKGLLESESMILTMENYSSGMYFLIISDKIYSSPIIKK